jgi:hypothetical protein
MNNVRSKGGLSSPCQIEGVGTPGACERAAVLTAVGMAQFPKKTREAIVFPSSRQIEQSTTLE